VRTRKLGPRREGPTREAMRFKWLIEHYERQGMSQSEFARLTGIEVSYINKLRNAATSGRSEIGASIIRRVRDGLKIDPSFFYEDYDGPKDPTLFLLSAKRDEKRVKALEDAARQTELEFAQLKAMMAQQHAELVQLRQEVATSSGGAGGGTKGGGVSKKRSG